MSRILFLVSSMQGGGAERVAALLSNHWAERGHQVTLMPTFSGRGECLYPLNERVRLDYLADRVSSQSRSQLNKLRRLIALRSAIRQLEPDVVVSFLSDVNVAGVIAATGMGVPVVVSERIYPPALPLGSGLETLRRWAYPRADAVVVQTQQAEDWLKKHIPRARAQVIPNPVVYPLPGGSPRVESARIGRCDSRLTLAVGRLVPQKGFGLLLDAFKPLADAHPDWQLVILGEGPERQRLEQQRERLGLTGRVHLPGRVGNLADWYARADLYVMSSRFEGFPNTLIEAMAHGLPAVSVDCDAGPRDIICDGVNGRLVPPAQGVDGLRRAMGVLMDDATCRRQMGEAAQAVRERFSMERVAAQWDAVLGLARGG